jgi:hypothetical protein
MPLIAAAMAATIAVAIPPAAGIVVTVISGLLLVALILFAVETRDFA